MQLGKKIEKLRKEANLTQLQLAETFGVSLQSVQKWESDITAPDLEKIIAISKYFNVSADALIFGNDDCADEEMRHARTVKPQYQNLHNWEFYPSNLEIEYRQSTEEGLDIECYRDVFSAVAALPKGEIKERLGDVLFDVVTNAKQKEGYRYTEPSELEKIRALRIPAPQEYSYAKSQLEDRIHGAWMGRICGCMLGKSVECIHTDELIPFLKETDNYPMHRYIFRKDLDRVNLKKYKFDFASRSYADEIDGMPVDDDTNYVVLAQELIRTYGRDFTPYNVAEIWLNLQGKNAYCTAERVAYCNFIKGFSPPASAIFKNPFREWIGAQIRGDYFGYINPANPTLAAEMAWRDASVSHIKNGIYGEMFVSAMISVAACTDDAEQIIEGGLSQIPYTSRLYEDITAVLSLYRVGAPADVCFEMIHKTYDEHTQHGWCHTNSNAMIVAAALLYGKGDFGKSICLAVQTGFDTDCNGATVGSVLGMAHGLSSIPKEWQAPFCDTLHTSIFGVDTVKISERAKMTLAHIECK